MLRLILASHRPDVFLVFAETLSSDPEVHLTHAGSWAAVLEAVTRLTPDLVIIDSDLPDTSPLDLVKKILQVNAMVNTAIVSPLSEAEFHEASEGLGVLSRLPQEPGKQEAEELLRKLRMVRLPGGVD